MPSGFPCAVRWSDLIRSGVLKRPRIVVARAEDRDKALDVFHQAEASCLVANSLLTKVEGEPDIRVRP